MKKTIFILIYLIFTAIETEGTDVKGIQTELWAVDKSPYVVTGDIVIPAGETLKIEPGVVIKFKGYYNFQINGTLLANGNIGGRIIFTSINDNEFGKVVTRSLRLPTRKDWQGIEFSGSSGNTSTMEYCIIRYSDKAISAANANPRLRQVIIADCNASTVVINGKKITILDAYAKDYNGYENTSETITAAPEIDNPGVTSDSTGPVQSPVVPDPVDSSVMVQQPANKDLDSTPDSINISTTQSNGRINAPVRLQLTMNLAFWYFQHKALGDYANSGDPVLVGRPVFHTHRNYINISCRINKSLFAEAECELNPGHEGTFYITKLRNVWSPFSNFQISFGRDFSAIAMADQVYYPISKYCLLASSPYLYRRLLYTAGGWDTGIHLSGALPIGFINTNAHLKLAFSITNGPGDQHGTSKTLVETMKANAEGLMFEGFQDLARQSWDNNSSKHLCLRVSFSPKEGLELGGSFADGKYDKDNKFKVTYAFAHFLYQDKKLTVDNEFGLAGIDVDSTNMMMKGINDKNDTWGDTRVTQLSYYFSFGYKIFEKSYFKENLINFFEPVFRYEVIDPWQEDTAHKGDRTLLWFGFRLSLYHHWIIRLAYSWQNEKKVNIDNNGYIIESVVKF